MLFGWCLLAVQNLFSTGATAQPASVESGEAKLVEQTGDGSLHSTKARQDWQVPGLAVVIVKDGKVVLSKGYGQRRVDAPDKVDSETLFAIASNSKAFTAAALAILVEEGKLSWDDRVSQHRPWFELGDPLASSDIRVRDLLCHRSGLGTFSGDLLWWERVTHPSRSPSERFFCRRRAHFAQRMATRPDVLAAGCVIEAVSVQTWTEFVWSEFCDHWR